MIQLALLRPSEFSTSDFCSVHFFACGRLIAVSSVAVVPHICTQSHKQGLTSAALLFISTLFMPIILLPWLRAATHKHPTCAAASTSHSYMATAPHPYRPAAGAGCALAETRLQERMAASDCCILYIAVMQLRNDRSQRRRTQTPMNERGSDRSLALLPERNLGFTPPAGSARF